MTIVYKDRVKETTTTTGTGSLSLGGALTGYQGFSTIGDGKECFACVHAVDGDGMPTGQWEVFRGTYTASGSVLSRDTVLSSSTGSAVDFEAGTKHVVIGLPSVECGTTRINVGVNSEFVFKSTKTGGGLGGNVLRLQQLNSGFYSCVYCVASDVADDTEGYGAAFGWGNSGAASPFAGRGYFEVYNALSSAFKPLALIQTSTDGFFRRYEAEAAGDQVFYVRDSALGEIRQLTLKNNGDVVVGTGSAIATDATTGFLRIPSCAGTPTGAAEDDSMVRDSTNHKVYFRSGGNWIALN